VDVNTVHEWTGDLGDVALDHGRGAHALAALVVEVATRAGVHGSSEHEAGRKAEAHGSARDRYVSVLKWLAQDLEYVTGEFGEFVKEQEAVVRERDLPRTGDSAATDEASV